MTNKRSTRTLIITLIFLAVLSAALCTVFAPFWSDSHPRYPSSTGGFHDHGDYKINLATIVGSLDHGDTNVFITEPEIPNTPSSSRILWHYSDFLKVVNALYQHVWHEPLSDWKAYEVLLSTSCENNLKGFETSRFTFIKTVWIGGSLFYAGRSMTILPNYDTVSWGGGTNFAHPIFGWKTYDLNRFKISADDALRIAEENGGEKNRVTYNNRCDIVLSLGDTGWMVAYDHFTIDIDPYTGTFKVLSTVK